MNNFFWNCLNPSSKSNIHPCSLWKLGIRAKICYSSGVNTPKPFQQGGKPSSLLILVRSFPHHPPQDFSRGQKTSSIPKTGSSHVSMDDVLILLQSNEKLVTMFSHILLFHKTLRMWLNWIKRIVDISFHHPALICSV